MQTKTKKILIPVVLGAGIVLGKKLWDSYDFIKNASVELKNLNIKSGNLERGDYSKFVFDLILILKNPTSLSGKITEINIDIFGNQKFLAKVQSSKKFEILPHKAVSFHSDVILNTDKIPNLINAIEEAIQNKSFAFNYVGFVKTNLGTFEINQQQNI